MSKRNKRTKKKKINYNLVELVRKPLFKIGQKVYIPQKRTVDENGEVLRTEIRNYQIEAAVQDNKLIGGVMEYGIDRMAIIRSGETDKGTFWVSALHIYDNFKDAEKACQFLKVEADEETWKKAIGFYETRVIKSKKEGEEDYEYEDRNIDDADLAPCCGNISGARDILFYCKEEGGLMVHDQRQLVHLLNEHDDFDLTKPVEPLVYILEQLEYPFK